MEKQPKLAQQQDPLIGPENKPLNYVPVENPTLSKEELALLEGDEPAKTNEQLNLQAVPIPEASAKALAESLPDQPDAALKVLEGGGVAPKEVVIEVPVVNTDKTSEQQLKAIAEGDKDPAISAWKTLANEPNYQNLVEAFGVTPNFSYLKKRLARLDVALSDKTEQSKKDKTNFLDKANDMAKWVEDKFNHIAVDVNSLRPKIAGAIGLLVGLGVTANPMMAMALAFKLYTETDKSTQPSQQRIKKYSESITNREKTIKEGKEFEGTVTDALSQIVKNLDIKDVKTREELDTRIIPAITRWLDSSDFNNTTIALAAELKALSDQIERTDPYKNDSEDAKAIIKPWQLATEEEKKLEKLPA